MMSCLQGLHFFNIFRLDMFLIAYTGALNLKGKYLSKIPKSIQRLWKGISIIYALQFQSQENQKWPTMLRWEDELQQLFSRYDCLDASRSAARLSHCINHKEIMSKIHLRWYMTPARFHHIKPDASKFCWRFLWEIGTQLHMWWQCPRTAALWHKVAKLLSDVLQHKIILTPKL